eukprot:TRINITY_DN131621_c0_g1_i1.p1 TRINITY_DN131621_c0_g1~~TRINITY_DN131621_c0_g1_i1.p1  ORF type:complete len:100 (-),score=13.42 TRINITY_DN131621_c0_g1_i1:50-349(-)
MPFAEVREMLHRNSSVRATDFSIQQIIVLGEILGGGETDDIITALNAMEAKGWKFIGCHAIGYGAPSDISCGRISKAEIVQGEKVQHRYLFHKDPVASK